MARCNCTVVYVLLAIRDGYKSYCGAARWQLLTQRLPSRGGGASAITVGDRIFLFLHGQGGGVCCYDPVADRYSPVRHFLPVSTVPFYSVICRTNLYFANLYYHTLPVISAARGGLALLRRGERERGQFVRHCARRYRPAAVNSDQRGVRRGVCGGGSQQGCLVQGGVSL